MAFHELATSAAEYGALSTASGPVRVRWRVKDRSGADGLTIAWQEHGGPAVSPPKRRGFGSMLAQRALSAELRGSAGLVFDPEGVQCRIRAPLPGGHG